MTLDEFASQIKTDPAYRLYITKGILTDTLPEEEELLLLEYSRPPLAVWMNALRELVRAIPVNASPPDASSARELADWVAWGDDKEPV